MSIYKGYERIDGSDPGHTELFVRENALDIHGEPDVDFDNFTRIFKDDLGISIDEVRLFHGRWSGHISGPLAKLSLGYHLPGSKTIHSAIWPGGYHVFGDHMRDPDVDGTAAMPKLIRLGVGVAEARNRRIALNLQRTAAASPFIAGSGLLAVDGDPFVGSLVACGSLLGLGIYESSKKQRREEAEAQIYPNHAYDIVFPDTMNVRQKEHFEAIR